MKKKTSVQVQNIVMPTCRRVFPELVASKIVGVQPMSGPVGFAFALRATYGESDESLYARWKASDKRNRMGFKRFVKEVAPTLRNIREL